MLRSALALSMITGRPFRMTQIRGQRPKPGLMRQHLTCVQASAHICQGTAEGAELRSTEVQFAPGALRAGEYSFAIGTAGSTALLAQTLLPALWGLPQASTLRLTGGTHNPLAPTADFLLRAYLPALARMGVGLEGEVVRHGFVPAGGGEIAFKLPGGQRPCFVEFVVRGAEVSRSIDCLAVGLPPTVPEKEVLALQKGLSWPTEVVGIRDDVQADCGGNILSAEIAYEHVTEHVAVHGERGKASAQVAGEVVKRMRDYLRGGAVVGVALADQLLLPMALAGGGRMIMGHLTNHVLTNVGVIERFLPVRFRMDALGGGLHMVVCEEGGAR